MNAPGGHLEAVTGAENTRRAVAYVQRFPDERVHHGAKRWCTRGGHTFDEVNTGIDAWGRRYCKTCRHEHLKIWRKQVVGQPDRRPEFHIDADAWLANRSRLVPHLTEPQLTSSEAAQLCGISRNAFVLRRRRNPGPLRLLGRQGAPRFCQAEVEAMLGFRSAEPWSRLKKAR